MADRKPEHTRKVSFAAEPQINYIYHEEANSTKTSSSVAEVNMEYTTDVPEFRRLSLFHNPDEENLNESLESLFITKGVEEYHEDPVLLREYVKRRGSLGRKESLDPLKALAASEMPGNDPAGCAAPEIAGGASSPGALERDEAEAAHVENETNTPAPDKQGDRKSLEASFNDTAITNSSFVVEELVNTMDLRKLVQHEAKEKRNLSEYLASLGIRFLDDSMADAMRRDTLSKSRNEVDPALFYHYKYSLKERIDYLYNFSVFLGERMKELQTEINEAQKDVDVESLNKDLLKKIRNEARNNSKIDWYNLRKLNELQFNKTVASNRQKLQELLNAKRKELDGLGAEIAEKSESVRKMKEAGEEVHRRLMQTPAAELQEAEKLQRMISERMGVLEAVKGECAVVAGDLAGAALENRHLEDAIAKLRAQNESLRNNLLIKSINESELDEMKRITQRYYTTFRIRFVKISKTGVVLSIYGHAVTISLDEECRVLGSSISAKDGDPVFSLAEPPAGVAGLVEHVRLLVRRFIFLQLLKNEIGQLQERMRVEMFFVSRQLHLRIFPGANRPFLDLVVNSSFFLSCRGATICNIQETLGGLSAYVDQAFSTV